MACYMLVVRRLLLEARDRKKQRTQCPQKKAQPIPLATFIRRRLCHGSVFRTFSAGGRSWEMWGYPRLEASRERARRPVDQWSRKG